MKRIGILTAGGDTPALNATIHGAVTRANQLRVEVYGFIKGFNSLFNPNVPHVHLNPLFQAIPELDPTQGGTLIGSSRDYVDANDAEGLNLIVDRLEKLGIEGLICIGGDGTLNGLQPITERLPAVLAPKTIDNDLGLNYEDEPNEWLRTPCESKPGYKYERRVSSRLFDLDNMVNYATPGYATAVYVSANGVERVRTTAESHRRIAIVEVMGRDAGYLALGAAYGMPDLVLVPEHRLNLDLLVERVRELYDLQKNVVIVVGEGIVDAHGEILGATSQSFDPAGNIKLNGAAEALRDLLIERIGDSYFHLQRRGNTAAEAIFTRKIGHTQRGGRPVNFDRFYASQLGAKTVDMLLEGYNNRIATLQYTRAGGFTVGNFDANRFRDRWGLIHARQMHPSFYDPNQLRPSRLGIEYLLPIFTNAFNESDAETIFRTSFAPSNITQMYHSVNTDVHKRIRYIK